jgi:hypothetical protein
MQNPCTGLPVNLSALFYEPVKGENNSLEELPASQTVSPAREPKGRLNYLL